EDLTRTERAQPALYAVSYALWETWRERAPLPAGAAGHSLGEYTALAAAGAMSFGDGLTLVAARGAAMAAAANVTAGGMAALLGGEEEAAETMASRRRDGGGSLWVANRNAPGQVVIAGGLDDLDWAGVHAGEHGIRRVIPLKVAGAFHTPLMAPAAAELGLALAATTFAPAAFAVWGNADATPIADPVDALARQLVSPVRFEETLLAMANAGIDTFVHLGPGEVTAGLARRTLPAATVHVVGSVDDVAATASAVH
ncbi:MAG: ACP S-malonyltransferase, partial [Acidimicrobiia bacterium]|nr:ACP S-malonyltransferase [Acidimicrobiia bacterium]